MQVKASAWPHTEQGRRRGARRRGNAPSRSARLAALTARGVVLLLTAARHSARRDQGGEVVGRRAPSVAGAVARLGLAAPSVKFMPAAIAGAPAASVSLLVASSQGVGSSSPGR